MKTKLTLQQSLKIALYIAIFLLPFATKCQENFFEWRYKTKGHIMNAPTVVNGTTFIGSYDSLFYAIDSLGEKLWSFKTDYPIQSGSVIYDSIVSFQSGNRLYGLNIFNGSQVWKHEPDEVKNNAPNIMINDIDIKDASPVLKDSIAYYGNEYGKFYGVDLITGKELFVFDTEKGVPITSTAVFSNDTMYLADMEGYVFAINMATNEKLWEMRTYDGNKPYKESGPIIGNLVKHGDLLYFGLQNGILPAINRFNGTIEWSIGDKYGTWYSGTPLLADSVMYIGTSDSRKLLALNASTGQEIWSKPIERGLYNQPYIYNNKIIVTGGYDTYEKLADENGSGRIVILDFLGNILNKISLPGSVFGNVVVKNNKLYYGSMDNYIYCISLKQITSKAVSVIEFENTDLVLDTITGKTSEKLKLPLIYNNGTKLDTLTFEWKGNLPDESVSVPTTKTINAQDSGRVNVTIKSKLLENNEYTLVLKIKSKNNPDQLIEKNIIFTRKTVAAPDKTKSQESVHVYPNPFNDIVNLKLPASFSEGSLTIYNVQGKLIYSQFISSQANVLSINASALKNEGILIYHLSDNKNNLYHGKLIRE